MHTNQAVDHKRHTIVVVYVVVDIYCGGTLSPAAATVIVAALIALVILIPVISPISLSISVVTLSVACIQYSAVLQSCASGHIQCEPTASRSVWLLFGLIPQPYLPYFSS